MTTDRQLAHRVDVLVMASAVMDLVAEDGEDPSPPSEETLRRAHALILSAAEDRTLADARRRGLLADALGLATAASAARMPRWRGPAWRGTQPP